MRILHIEDEPSNREVTKDWLGAEGHHVDSAPTVQQGIDKAKRAQPPYDVIITDGNIAGETDPDDNFGAARAVVGGLHQANLDTPVIVFSGTKLPDPTTLLEDGDERIIYAARKPDIEKVAQLVGVLAAQDIDQPPDLP